MNSRPAPNILIRDARREDLPRIIAMLADDLLADDLLGAAREDPEGPPAATYVVALDDILSDPRNAQIVAELDGEVVGTMQITFIPNLSRSGAERGQLEGVRVARPHRAQGIGRVLLKEAIRRCQEQGCQLIQLTTDKTRGEAVSYYESLGFVASHVGLKLPIGQAPTQAPPFSRRR